MAKSATNSLRVQEVLDFDLREIIFSVTLLCSGLYTSGICWISAIEFLMTYLCVFASVNLNRTDGYAPKRKGGVVRQEAS